jgi:uncharacterized protein YxjI
MLDRKTFFVKERVGFLKLVGVYDILDPASGRPIGTATETISTFIKVLRLFLGKRLLPTTVTVAATDGRTAMTFSRGGIVRPTVDVRDANGNALGSLKGKLISIGPSFTVHDTAGNEIADVKGDWKGWNFKLLSPEGRELGTVTKKWAGVGKELLTTADNYVIALDERATMPASSSALLLAAGLAIDLIYKEKN